jgi:hypothetical protein
MKRLLLNVLTALCLLLTIATLTLWALSHWTIGAISYSAPRQVGIDVIDRAYGIYDEPGVLGFCRSEYTHGDISAEEIPSLLNDRGWTSFAVPASDVANDTVNQRFFDDWTHWRFYTLGIYDYLSGGEEKIIVKLPMALIVAFFSIVPLWKAHRMRRNYKRRNDQLCSHCGYDLRASPERCPECGTVHLAKTIISK